MAAVRNIFKRWVCRWWIRHVIFGVELDHKRNYTYVRNNVSAQNTNIITTKTFEVTSDKSAVK